MMKKLLSLAMAALLLFACLPLASAATIEELTGAGEFDKPKTMYVHTDDGGRLNVRSEPRVSKKNLLGRLDYAAKVTVLGTVVVNGDWVVISYKKGPNGVGYVQRRYLSSKRPTDKSKAQREKENREELNRQVASARPLANPVMLAVRAPRVSGWVNFRVGPGVAAGRIVSLPDGYQLQAIGETNNWYQAMDPQTGNTGYISKNYVDVLPEPVTPVVAGKEQMGTLNVNGEFALQCKLPEGYKMQIINMLNQKISAFITSTDLNKPILQLSIAFNELYSEVERMNDLTPEALQALEATFTEMNDVNITYGETAYGTKLLIAREVGNDTDFVDILSVYKGYQIEFVMTPNPQSANTELTDQQVQMCVDFLSELDFVENK